LKSGESAEARVADLAQDGRGVARVGGKAVFIDGALPGERVRFRVSRSRRQLDEAELIEVLEASPDRVEPRCAHFGVCGGCTLQHLAPAAQLKAKETQLLDTLERLGKVTPRSVLAPLAGPPFAYRRRARLGVKFVHKKGRVLAGFRERNKPYIADLQRCETLLERFATLPAALAELVGSLELRERLPQVELAAGDAEAALVFRVLQEPGDADRAALARFGREHRVQVYLQPGGPASVVPLEAPPAPSPASTGDPPPQPAPLSYALDGGSVVLEFGPLDFVQVNGAINSAMVARALQVLDPQPSDRVLDLFCGLGNFTLPIARRAGSVVGVEGDEMLLGRARANAARNGLTHVEFAAADLFQPSGLGAWEQGPYDLVLLDPPRAGALSMMERMPQWGPRRVVYISCHPGSLARDAGLLVGSSHYELVGAGVMDMFPQTAHVESIAVFERTRELGRR
jgi:23S rRNA (uracil1939-C5)-methyltransferase